MATRIDFSEPRRLAPLSVIVAIADPKFRNLLLVSGISAFGSGIGILLVVAATAIVIVASVVEWLRTHWWFDGEVLVITSGVFVRHDRRLVIDRIQHTEIERRFLHLVTGLAVLRVETAGGGSDAEVELEAITTAEATALKDQIEAARLRLHTSVPAPSGIDPIAGSMPWSDSEATPLPPPTGPRVKTEPILRLEPSRLALGGVTGPELAAVFAAVGIAVQGLSDVGFDPDEQTYDVSRGLIGVLALGAILLWLGSAAVVGIVRFWDLRVTVEPSAEAQTGTDDRAGDTLRVEYGLFRQTELTAAVRRVQVIQANRTVLRRIFGYVDLELRSASGGASRKTSTVRIPMLRLAEAETVIGAIMTDARIDVPLCRPPDRAKVRLVIRATAPTVLAAAFVARLVKDIPWLAVVLSTFIVAAGIVVGLVRHRILGVAQDGRYLISRTGTLSTRTTLAPVARVQSASAQSSVFQRRRRLATVGVDVPGRRITMPERDVDEATGLVRWSVSAPA